jgi:hypothetical protein
MVVTMQMSAGDRLQILEWLDRRPDDHFPVSAVAAIGPGCDTFAAIVAEARSLDTPGSHCEASFRVLVSAPVFQKLVQLNTSLLDAIRLMPRPAWAAS